MNDSFTPDPSLRLDGSTAAPQTAALLSQAAEQASALAQRGLDAVRDGSQSLRDSARRASDNTLDYIQAEPLKAVLMAAAAGAALMALVGLLARRSGRD